MSGVNFNSTTNKAYREGGTDVAVVDGGTGASTASDARTNLGVAIGTDVQAHDADLDAVAGLSSNGVIARTGAGTAAARTITGTTNRIAVTDGDGVSGNPTLDIGSDVYTVGGTDVAVADGGTGASDAATARTNLGLGSIATQDSDNVSITGGTISGTTITDQVLDIQRDAVADADKTALAGETVIAYTSITVTRTVTLPAAATAGEGKVYIIKDESGSVTTSVKITIDGNAAETIDGAATIDIDVAYGVARLYSDGSNWFTF